MRYGYSMMSFWYELWLPFNGVSKCYDGVAGMITVPCDEGTCIFLITYNRDPIWYANLHCIRVSDVMYMYFTMS